MILAIDTSSETAGLALLDKQQVIAEIAWRCGQNHTIQLLPQLNNLLKSTGLSLSDITCVVVAKGPGSFNGLRVGISTAKGLSFSLEVPIIGVSTLEAAAYQHIELGLPVCAIAGAGRSEIAMAIYQEKRGKCQQLTAEHLTTVDVLINEIQTKTVFCGEYLPQAAGVLAEKLGTKAVIPRYIALTRRAAYLAELGSLRLKAGELDNPATLQPLYLRKPPITERKHT
ncbi:MAG: tRNA (adenosine(37)-N6)-threonylcarbamoyltransferase complex dimerization subunit type 1 TsaB [Dehalococcoidales bacterium]|nr:tRNA (adenosine(37)-N6)-threonylcarbamoyltransferase complex dimerization subunit type 1 TsaB [Dehalococcoidales bacterium]